MHRINKGEYGYISARKKMTVIRTVVFFALCAAVFAAGYITTGSRNNLLTIVAVLGCLPASKSLVNTIMFMRAKGCSPSAHDTIISAYTGGWDDIQDETVGKKMLQAYDLYMTSYKTNYPVSHITVCGSMVTGLLENAGADTMRECEKHIDEHLKADGYKNITVKIYSDPVKYTERLNKLSELDTDSGPSADGMMETLKAISL